MNEVVQGDFLRKRMTELREKNGKSISKMAELLGLDKSILSRAESGKSGYKTIKEYAEMYCNLFQLTDEQKALFMRGDKVVVVDTSALIKNVQLVDELSKEYSHVVVPKVVIDELDNIKDHREKFLASKAWQILRSISSNENVETRDCSQHYIPGNNDEIIISVAREVSGEYKCEVDIITYDTGFAARLRGDDRVHALFLEEYLITKQSLIDMSSIKAIDDYYADLYDDLNQVLKIKTPNREEINAFLPNGNTLIISVVRNRSMPLEQRKKKIQWLISCGADVDKRDCGKYYFPPLTHSIQNGDFEMFKFLLHECKANPNVGSRNPHDAGKIRQKNDGNMPLMVAAWDNKVDFLKELLSDERTSINQQDGNGFTALIKACYWGFHQSRDLLIAAGADTKIVDRDGYTAEGRYEEYLETGRRKNPKSFKPNHNGGNRHT